MVRLDSTRSHGFTFLYEIHFELLSIVIRLLVLQVLSDVFQLNESR